MSVMSRIATEIEELYFEEGLDVGTIAFRVQWPEEQVRFHIRSVEDEVMSTADSVTITDEEVLEMARYYGED